VLSALPGRAPAAQATPDVEYRAVGDAPRLLLNARHLRLIQRERERRTMRWEQFATLVEARAPFEEPGLAQALYGVATGAKSACETAFRWAESEADPNKENDLRQMALAADWCGRQVDAARHTALLRRLLAAAPAHPRTNAEARTAAFAALAAADLDPQRSAALLRDIVERWWRQDNAPRLERGADLPEPRGELLALVELVHVLVDSLHIDLRDDAPSWFAELPERIMLGYAPAPWQAGGNAYRIVERSPGEPDLRQSVWSRAAELALVAADPNAQPAQFLQGWLMQDRFLLRTTLGAPYEFLWANPYLPGLSYTHAPPYFHAHGRLLARSGWEDGAAWFGYGLGAGALGLLDRNGRRSTLDMHAAHPPIELGAVRIFRAANGLQFEAGWTAGEEDSRPTGQVAFLLGLTPNESFTVDSPGEKQLVVQSDEGGIVELHLRPERKGRVRLSPVKAGRRE
jgi:hypothetical protein